MSRVRQAAADKAELRKAVWHYTDSGEQRLLSSNQMVDVEKQVAYWRASSFEDLAVARELVEIGRFRHGLFFAHLALEKALKAHVCHTTTAIAPKTHSLLRLSELSGLELDEERETFLAEFGRFQIEGRYPGILDPPPTKEEAKAEILRCEEMHSWLMAQ